MILGFAHTTENRSAVPIWFVHHSVPNPREKWPLMARQATRHDLALMQWGIEIVAYDTGVMDAPGRLSLHDDAGTIAVRSRDVQIETTFLCGGLGFQKQTGGVMLLKSALPSWRVCAAVVEDPAAPIDPPLDIAGRCALAFYSSDVEADRDRAIAAGGRTPTEPFFVTLERKMKIIMLRSPEGTIIELIEVQPHD